jgi:transcriptional regulator with XRE-family HTH domain
MPAPKGNQHAKGNPGGGRKSDYRPEFAKMAEQACRAGFTDIELADLFGVSVRTIGNWKNDHEEFLAALKPGKAEADARVERSLYARATGYEHDEVDIRVIEGQIVKTEIRKYYPPDTAAAAFWLKNRAGWRDKTETEHSGSVQLVTKEQRDAAVKAALQADE